MLYPATILRVLIASPSDVPEERAAVREVIHDWNEQHAAETLVVLVPVMWETHATPEMGGRPQEIINRQLVRDCDILVGVFWTRIGTDTGVAVSGTVEEIQEFVRSGKPVMLYFSLKPIMPDNLDQEQYGKLKKFREECEATGLVQRYAAVAELREQLLRHFSSHAKKHAASLDASAQPAPKRNDADNLVEELSNVIERLAATWVAERDSEPHSIDEGKQLLRAMGDAALRFRVPLADKVPQQFLERFDEIARQSRILQRHQLFLDGRKSYDAFWKSGDELIEASRAIIRDLRAKSSVAP